MTTSISRRSFLKITGLTIAVSATPLGFSVINASAQKEGSFKPSVWFEITPNDRVTMTMARAVWVPCPISDGPIVIVTLLLGVISNHTQGLKDPSF